MLAGSLIKSGSGKAVVCCVGSNTLKEEELDADDLVIHEEETPLSIKLTELGAVIGKWAQFGALIAMFLFTIFWLCNIFFG